MAEKLKKQWNSLQSRKRKVDSILRHQSKMLRADAEHYCDAEQRSTSTENEHLVSEETMGEEKYDDVHNINLSKTQSLIGNSPQSSANSTEVIDDTDEENYCANTILCSNNNINRQQSKANIKQNEKLSKRQLKRYLRSAKFGEYSVVPTNNSLITLPPPLAICQNRKSQELNTQATPIDEVLTADVIQTTSIGKEFTANVIQDRPTGDVVFAPEPEIDKITPTNSTGEELTADVIQYMPSSNVFFAPEPEINKIIPPNSIEEFSADDILFAPAPEIKQITQTNVICEEFTTNIIQDVPTAEVVFGPEPEINKISKTTPYDVLNEPRAHHSRDITEIVTKNNDDDSALLDQPQVYTSLKTVEFEEESEDIEETKGSPSLIINMFDTCCFDTVTDTSDRYTKSVNSSKKFHKKILKSYVDYLSDNEDFSAGSSDLWSMNESESSINSENKKKKYTKKKQNIINKEKTIKEYLTKVKTKKENRNELRKRQKNSGQSYETRSGSTVEEKSMKINPCLPNVCARKCYEISEDRRMSLFNYFWTQNAQRQKDWIVRCAQPIPIKRKKTKSVESRRGQTYEYVINEGEGSRQVCQKFLINTLDITQKYILYTVKNAHENMASLEKRTCHAHKYSDEDKAYAKEFIESLPAVPSHYCRKKSSCLYLPQEFKNVTNLFRIYRQHCQNNSKLHLSEKVFIKIFNDDYNIRFHIPKKDKCVICTKAENTELLSESEIKAMSVHLEEKKASYQRFKIHQKLTSNDTLTVSFDLQKVLNTPHGESMLLYYSRKYAVYNCTFYESQTKKGHCYIWGETDGKRGGNEIATCIYKFLLEIDKRPVKNVLLYCDSCPGQNKNKIVLTALHYFLQNSENVEVVQINYLLPGHTYMPVDSMHAVIEREVRRIIVWSPSQWPTYMESARKRPEPYIINVLEYSDFLNWESLVSELFSNISQRQIQLKAMRIVTFKKKYAKTVEVKYSMRENEDAQVVTLYDENKGRGSRGKGKGKKTKKQNQHVTGADKVDDTSSIVLSRLYEKPNPIPIAKYNDLKRLCTNGTIPKRFHKEYVDLPSLGTVKDSLPETDEEDESTLNDL